MSRSILVVPDAAALAETAARRFLAAVGEAVAARGLAHVVLSGGSTPAYLYRILASPDPTARLDWSKVDFWWGDERAVPPDDPASNYRLARNALLSHFDLDPKRIHRMPADPDELEASARRYEEEMRRHVPTEGELPRFDLVLLGIGADGHTASLFPMAHALTVRDRWVVAVHEAADHPRLTLSLPAINAARVAVLLAAGTDKARAVARAIDGDPGPDSPASLVRPTDGLLYWIIDEAADLLRHGGWVGEGDSWER